MHLYDSCLVDLSSSFYGIKPMEAYFNHNRSKVKLDEDYR